MRLIIRLVFIFLLCSQEILAEGWDSIYNILDFGAVADSLTVNTLPIQKAIDECSRSGGGIVLVPEGKFVSGTILIKDNVNLKLESGAVLLGSTDIEDYQMIDPFLTGNSAPLGYCFVGALEAKNIAITGKGTIDGRGVEVRKSGGQGRRPLLMRIVRCEGVEVSGVHLTNSTAWTTHFFASRNILIDGISIYCRGLSNNDGIGIDCSQDVKITNCDIDTGDDGLVFKTTWSGMACKNIEVRNLRITSNHAGIKTGTESMAPFENIRISDVYIYNTNNGGIKLNSVDGAHMRNIEISDIVMDNVRTPMLIRLGSRLNVFRKDQDVRQETGSIENVVIRNVKAKAAAEAQLKPPSGILVTGIPGHPVRNLVLENIEIDLAGGGTAEHSRQVVPEAVSEYPEIRTFGPTIPAYGIWARHIDGLVLKNIRLNLENPDLRPAVIIQDGRNTLIRNSVFPVYPGAESVIRLEEVSGAVITRNTARGNAEAFVQVEGLPGDRMKLTGNRIQGVRQTIIRK